MKTQKTLSVLAAALITSQGVLATSAFASPGDAKRPAMELSAFDADGDGEVTVSEFDQVWSEKAKAWKEKKGQRHAKKGEHGADLRGEEDPNATRGRDASGSDAHEKPERKRARMAPPSGADIDTNGDGIISDEEFSAAKESWKKPHPRKGDKDREPHLDSEATDAVTSD